MVKFSGFFHELTLKDCPCRLSPPTNFYPLSPPKVNPPTK